MVSPEESRRTAQSIQVPYHELQLISSTVQELYLDVHSCTEGYEPEKQPVMCDFEIIKNDENLSRFFVTLAVEMENTQNADGRLSFSLSTITELEFRPSAKPTELPEDEQVRWSLFSIGLSTAISMVRGYLTNYLAPTVYRGYQLPLLSIDELINKRYRHSALPSMPSSAPSEKPPTKPKKKDGE